LRSQLGTSQDELEATRTLNQEQLEALGTALSVQEQLRLTVARLADEVKELTSVRAVLTEEVIAVSAQLTATAQGLEEAKGEMQLKHQETAGLKATVAALTLETAEFALRLLDWPLDM
jgi:chromosome segregation ATPase